jgi:hypothetical protein
MYYTIFCLSTTYLILRTIPLSQSEIWLINWWLTSTLAVFQLYRGMTINMYHTRGEYPNLHHRCGSIFDTWSVILNTIVSIKPNRRKVWRYEKGNQSHQNNIYGIKLEIKCYNYSWQNTLCINMKSNISIILWN